MLFLIFFLSLQCIGLYSPCSGDAIKRESGANPEQSAAVSFTSDCCKQPPLATGKHFLGRRLSTETSQKTCLCIFFIAFEEKALSLMSRNYSIRHFIHHSDSEKVSYDNKLCQVYLVCPAEVSSSGHFNNKKQR